VAELEGAVQLALGRIEAARGELATREEVAREALAEEKRAQRAHAKAVADREATQGR
jgi:hypothetical protein